MSKFVFVHVVDAEYGTKGKVSNLHEAEAPSRENCSRDFLNEQMTALVQVPAELEADADLRFLKANVYDQKWVKDGELDTYVDPQDETYQVVQGPFVELYVDGAVKTAAQAADQQNQLLNAVTGAIAFGQKLLTEFSAENISLGITQDGQTKSVRTKMAQVTAALQTGSLYDALDECMAIQQADYDVKYITAARLVLYGNKLRAYLGKAPVNAVANLLDA